MFITSRDFPAPEINEINYVSISKLKISEMYFHLLTNHEVNVKEKKLCEMKNRILVKEIRLFNVE